MKKFLLIIVIIFVLLLSTKDEYHKYITSNTIDANKLETSEPILEKLSKRPTIFDEVKSLLYKYPSLEKNIKNAFIKVPSDEGFIPQGIEIVNSYIFITGYFEENRNSLCYILDESGKDINKVEFDMSSHVGSISYDKNTNLVFIPGEEDSVLAYNVFDFFTKSKVNYIHKFEYLGNEFIHYKDKEKKEIAYLTVDDIYLYIGSFSKNSSCLIKKYLIESQASKIKLTYIESFSVNEKIQGIDFINKDDKKYMLLSSSFGRIFSSNLYVYLYEDGKSTYENYLKKYTLPPMLEQISCYGNSLYLLFESNAYKYSNALDKINYIIEMNIDKIIEE